MVRVESMHGLNGFWVDIVVAGVIIVSTIMAVVRGFVRETLSILAWAAAAFAALYFGAAATALLRPHISTPFAAPLLAYAGIFFIVLIPLAFASYRISHRVRHSRIGMLDRGLGVPFGIVRGLALVGIAYLAVTLIVPIDQQPVWLTRARLLPLLQYSSGMMSSLIPDIRRASVNLDDAIEAEHSRARLKTEGAAQKTDPAADRRASDQLIQNANATGNGK
ncbi:MAG TPA: CvpA family protein [Rhizomicrobium sp.]